MLTNALFHIFAVSFIGSFVALAALGHVFLVEAIWPDLFKSPAESRGDTVPGTSDRMLHRPG